MFSNNCSLCLNSSPHCLTCHGSGEVSAGIFFGQDYGPTFQDTESNKPYRQRTLEKVNLNPAAYSTRHQTIFYLDFNPLHPGFSIAICQSCHGTGLKH